MLPWRYVAENILVLEKFSSFINLKKIASNSLLLVIVSYDAEVNTRRQPLESSHGRGLQTVGIKVRAPISLPEVRLSFAMHLINEGHVIIYFLV